MASLSNAASFKTCSGLKAISLLGAAIVLAAVSGCTSMADSNMKSTSITAQTSHAFTAKVIKPKSKAAALGRSAATIRSSARAAGSVPFYGRAPYICTPSGFGQTTRCFARN